MCLNSEKSVKEPWSLRPVLWTPSSSRPPCRGSKMKKLIFRFPLFRSQDDNGDTKSRFTKTKSLREKFRDSRPWTNLRKSAEKEIPAPNPAPTPTPAATNNGPEQTATEGRLSRLFSLRRSVGPSKSTQVNQGLGIRHWDPNALA